jgi:hypothetical protein
MISYYLTYLIFLIFIGIVGFSILFIVRKKIHLSFFESLLIALFSGYILSISIFSIIQTGFKTVNIFYILLLVFALREVLRLNSVQKAKIINLKLKFGLWLLGSTFLFYGLAYYSFYTPASFISFNFNHTDYILYAKIAKYLSITGEENGFNHLNQLDSYYNGPEPYHFFDLWGSSLTNCLFGINHYLGLRLVIYPTFWLLFFIATICLFQSPSWVKILIAFVIIWWGGFFLDIFQSVPPLKNLSNITTNLFNPGLYKLSFFYVFILCSYLLYRKNHFGLCIILLLGLIIANIITLPTLLIALFTIMKISYSLNVITKDRLFTIFSYIVIFSVLLVAFYGFFKSERSGLAGAEITSPLALIQDSFSIQNLRTQRNIILVSVISLLVLYFPIIFILLKRPSLITIKNLPLVFVIAVVFISISIWAVLFYELNSSQIFYNISTTTLNVSAIILIISSIDSGVLLFKTTSISVWCINFLILLTLGINVFKSIDKITELNEQTHSCEFLKRVFESIPENELVATLKSPKEMEEIHFKYNAVYPLGNYLFLFDKNINSVNINDLNTPIDSTSKMNITRGHKAIRDGLFYRFAHLEENKDLSRSVLTIKFLKKFDIKFLIASKNVELPEILVVNTKNTITDSISGERFIELKNNLNTIIDQPLSDN